MSFSSIVTWPFAWLMMTFYNWFTNYGIAVILFAVAVKIVLLPFQMKSKHSMMRSSRLTPYMKDLEKKYEGNKQKYQEEVSKLYKDEKINPMSGCLWSIVPLVFIYLIYNVIRQPYTVLMHLTQDQFTAMKNVVTGLGSTVPTGGYPELNLVNFVHQNFSSFQGISDKLVNLDLSFLGMNLGKIPDWKFFMSADWTQTSGWLPSFGLFFIPIISGVLAYVSYKVSMAGNPPAMNEQQQGTMKSMALMMPLMSVFFGFTMPAAVGVYWIAQSALAAVQDAILNRHYNKILDKEDAERRERFRAREEELERKRLETEKLKEAGLTERNKNTSKKKIQANQKAQNDERLAGERAEEKAKRRAELGLTDEKPASQIGNRKYARGRAFVEDRYTNPEGAEEATLVAAELSAIDEAVDNEFDENTSTEITDTAADNSDNGGEA